MPRKILTPEQLNFQPRPGYPYTPGTRAGALVANYRDQAGVLPHAGVDLFAFAMRFDTEVSRARSALESSSTAVDAGL